MKAGIFRNTVSNEIVYIGSDQRVLAFFGITGIHEIDDPPKVSYSKAADTALRAGAQLMVRLSDVPPEHKGKPYAALKWYRNTHATLNGKRAIGVVLDEGVTLDPVHLGYPDAVPAGEVAMMPTPSTVSFTVRINREQPHLAAADIENPSGKRLPELRANGNHVIGWVCSIRVDHNGVHTVIYRAAEVSRILQGDTLTVHPDNGEPFGVTECRKVKSGICHGKSARKHRKVGHRVYRIPNTNRYYWEH